MSATEWESKFKAIVRDTVHNLDRVKVRVSCSLTVYIAVSVNYIMQSRSLLPAWKVV